MPTAAAYRVRQEETGPVARRPAAVAVPTRHGGALTTADEGLSLVEVIVALFIVAVVMTSSAIFFINGLKNASLQTQRQTSVSLANQALEAVQAVKPSNLLKGRTQADVDALFLTPGAATYTAQDVVDSGYWDPSATSAQVDTVSTDTQASGDSPIVAGMTYRVRTFIDLCYVRVNASGQESCTATLTAKSVFRATVAVTWTPKTVSCPGGCRYSASVLIDRQGDPQFNSNVSQPVIDTVTPGTALVSTTKTLTISGSGFVAGAVVSIEAGGGTMGPVTGNSGLQASAVWNVGSVAGSYLLSLTNPDGGRAFYTLTVTPGLAITDISPAPVRALLTTNVTLTGTGFQSGATITMTNGTVTNAVFVSATKITADVRPDGTQLSPATVTLTNPNGGGTTTAPLTLLPSQPSITTFVQGSIAAVNQPITITLTGSNFVFGAAVTSSSGTVSNPVSVTSSTSASFTFTPTTANTATTFTLRNPDSGQASSPSLIVATTTPVLLAPTLSNVTQGTVAGVGQQTTITLTGTNLLGSSVTTNTGTAGAPTVTATSVQFTFTPSQANTLTRFTVTTAGGTAFRDLSVATNGPAITGFAGVKANGNNNRVTVTFTGSGFVSGASVTASFGSAGTGPAGSVAGANVSVPSSTSMNFTVDFPNGTFDKLVTFTVTNPNGQTATWQQQVTIA